MKKAFFALAIFIAAFSAHAVDQVEGAFGLKLGEVFQPTKEPVSKFEFQGGYEFTPEKPNPAFSTYLVFVTPNDHLIYKIVAIGVGDYPTSSRMVETLRAILHRKYEDASGYGEIRQGNRNVSVVEGQPSNFGSLRIVQAAPQPQPAAPVRPDNDRARIVPPPVPEKYYSVVYVDLTVASQADRERSEIHLKELLKDADTTGL